jgi:hypothetical protein
MAHFAKLNNNNEVIDITKVNNVVITDINGVEQESLGINFLHSTYNDTSTIWKKTSFNTKQGKYYNQDGTEGDLSKAFRKNYASIGGIYDPIRDAFINYKPFNSWTLNETTCDWEPPIPYPNPSNGNLYQWNESTQAWDIAISA